MTAPKPALPRSLRRARRRVRLWVRRSARRWTRLRTRRPFTALAGAVTAAALLLGGANACSPFSNNDPAAPVAQASAQPTHHEVEDRSFPVTVTHRYGDTELADPPARIVTLGTHDQDLLISLGIRPVGIRDWPGTDRTYASLPWAPDDLEPGELRIASPVDEFDFAAVAALEPDLITVINSDVTEPEYLRLTEIAPTVAQVPDTSDFLASWQEETRLMARAVGRPRQAEQVITDIEAAIAAVRQANPVLSDTRVALVTYDGERRLRLVNPYEPRARLLAAMGMRFPESVAAATGASEFDVDTDLDVLAKMEDDFDLFVWAADPTLGAAEAAAAAAAMRADQDYTDIDPVRRGASVFLEAPEALAFASGLSLAYAAERNGRALAEALGGQPAADRSDRSLGPPPGEDPAGGLGGDIGFPVPGGTPTPGPAVLPAPTGGPTPAGDPAATPSAPSTPPAAAAPSTAATPGTAPALITFGPAVLRRDPAVRRDKKDERRRVHPNRDVRGQG